MGFLLLGLLGGFFSSQLFGQRISSTYATDSSCAYEYLNPLRCEPGTSIKIKEYVVLRNELLAYIEDEQNRDMVTDVAVYFRDLVNGPVMSIDGQESFAPASLLKVPLLMTYYKKAETDASLLSRRFTITGDVSSLPQNIKPEKSVVLGQEYSIDELLNLLVTQSDNIAWEALLSDLRQNYSEEDFVMTLSDLGIIDPRKAHEEQYITVQSYATIFRVLYNASYLNQEMSNRALEVLSQSSFHDGIVAGLPQGIKVAHKFGEYKNGAEQQLHDCGIVYYESNPYLLCVMSRGDNISELTSVMKEISRRVYGEVVNRN